MTLKAFKAMRRRTIHPSSNVASKLTDFEAAYARLIALARTLAAKAGGHP
jgi:hypothetical protein